MITKTIVSENPKLYSSFPTMVTCKDYLFIFYRQGVVNKLQPHGFSGKVKCIKLPLDKLDKFFNNNISIQDRVIFESQNELDAIVSKLDSDLYTLGTRIFVKNKINDVYLSVSYDCNFTERVKITIKDADLAAFYGKAINLDSKYIFSAYGNLKGESFQRPLLIVTSDFVHFELLSYLYSSPMMILNETSFVKTQDYYIAFSRKDTYPNYAIFTSKSKNLIDWSKPEKLINFGLAPMAINVNDIIYVSFRDIENGINKISIINTKTFEKKIIDTYKGNMFDGGYSDLIFIGGYIYVAYYTNNIAPFIKIAKIKPF